MINLISVIIPSYDSEKTIDKTIEALLKQNYPKNYEIIVVDDGSTDRTEQVVKKFKYVKFVKQKHKGPATARNLGAKLSKGNIILFTDSDCIPDKNWIKNMVEPFKDKEIVGVSGTYKTLNPDKTIARFIAYQIEQRHEKMKARKFINFIGTFSAAYRKKVFLNFGGFDTRFKTSSGEDPELSYRISDAGLKMFFQPKAFVYHPHPSSLRRYLKQQFLRGVWRNLMYWNKHKKKIFGDSYTPRSLFSQIFIFGLVSISFPLLIFLNYSLLFSFSLIFLSLFLVTFFFNIDFYFFLWRKEKKIILLSLILLTMRNLVVLFGIVIGLLKYIFKKFK